MNSGAKYKAAALALAMLIGLSVMPQSTLQVKPLPDCRDAELRAATAEANLAAAKAVAESYSLHAIIVTREYQKLIQGVGPKYATLSSSYQDSQRALASSEAACAELKADRDRLQKKIAIANEAPGCRILRIGCVTER